MAQQYKKVMTPDMRKKISERYNKWCAKGIFSVDTRQKASKTSVFDAFLLQKRWKWCESKCGSTAWPAPWPTLAGSQRLCRLLPAHAPWVQRNVRKEPKSTGEETFAFSPVFWRFYCLHDLRHEATHGLCCLVLLLPCGVGVGAEGEACVVVAERAGHLPHGLR